MAVAFPFCQTLQLQCATCVIHVAGVRLPLNAKGGHSFSKIKSHPLDIMLFLSEMVAMTLLQTLHKDYNRCDLRLACGPMGVPRLRPRH